MGNWDIESFAIAKSKILKFWTGLNKTEILQQTFKIIESESDN
jgi:hypothetical protein